MNFRLIVIFGIIRSVVNREECVQRKSGACKVFNMTDEFDSIVTLQESSFSNNVTRITTNLEIDYLENKYNYDRKNNSEEKEYDLVDNPVVEILFPQLIFTYNNYRLVLGEKLSRLAYLQSFYRHYEIKYNNYSPELPSWPFVLNITIDRTYNSTRMSVYRRNDDGRYDTSPFLLAERNYIFARGMSMKSRSKNVKLVGFYDCSTKYGSKCGEEKEVVIEDCRRKFSPHGNSFFTTFVSMKEFNRSNDSEVFHFDEIFGIYRRNGDSMHIHFQRATYGVGVFPYIRLVIGDDIEVRLSMYSVEFKRYILKTAVRKSWHQEPSEPNFIRLIINAGKKPGALIQYMSVTSNTFKAVDLYYNCCLKDDREGCFVNSSRNLTNTLTIEENLNEVEILYGEEREKRRKFLDTTLFDETENTEYFYRSGRHIGTKDFCIEEIMGVTKTPVTKSPKVVNSTEEIMGVTTTPVTESSKVVNSTEEIMGVTKTPVTESPKVVNSTEEIMGVTTTPVTESPKVVNSTEEIMGVTKTPVTESPKVVSSTEGN